MLLLSRLAALAALDEQVTPEDPTQGRANNQGLEGLTASPDGK
jgi:hypothetical protein